MARANTERQRRFVRLPEVLDRVGWSRSQIYKEISEGRFPKPIQLSARTVAWLEADLESWIESKIATKAGRDQRD